MKYHCHRLKPLVRLRLLIIHYSLTMTEQLPSLAIIGISLRVPGAQQLEQFWQNLRNGVESITHFDDETLRAAGIPEEFLNDPHYVKAYGLLKGVEEFDASFFDLTAREAEVMDPQHRLFLECAWEVLEHAGYDSISYPGRIGVYAGAGLNSYLIRNLSSNFDSILETIGGWAMVMSNDKDFIPTRVSYKMNLTGPSVCVGTGCSSSLVAVAMGCQSLLNYQSDMVLAGGVTIQLPQVTGYWYQPGGIMSPDGHCRAFDARAQGTLDANGVGIVLLKRLEDALADGDCIHAIIKGFAINNDGAAKVGYTAPSVDGQAKVVEEALMMADVNADTISYVEAHGTGTGLGDPIEVAALTQAYRRSTTKTGYCALGSVKSNLGHLDTAAGVASLIKTVLALKHRQIPPSLHFEQPNPNIDFANSPFYVNNQLTEWQTQSGLPRRAGVSSLGIGGTNAHVVLEEAPSQSPSGPSRPWQLLPLSAKTASALETMTQNLLAFLSLEGLGKLREGDPLLADLAFLSLEGLGKLREGNSLLADIAYTLAVGRRPFQYRRLVFCQTVEQAKKALQTNSPQSVFTHSSPEGKPRPVIFMFPGLGSEYPKMTAELYREEPLFREPIDKCAELLKPHLKWDVRDVLGMREGQSYALDSSTAPVTLFVVEYALAQLWMSYGIQPDAMLGYSQGEYVAACLAGVVSLEEALAMMAYATTLLPQLTEGRMLSILQPELVVRSWLGPELSLAAVNGVSQCIVSGTPSAVQKLQEQLLSQQVQCYLMTARKPLHSYLMTPLMVPLLEKIQTLSLQPPKIPWLSSITGTWMTPQQATDPRYYTQVISQTLRFSDTVQRLFQEEKEAILLEVGPGQVLSPLILQHPDRPPEQQVLSTLKPPQYGQPELSSVLTTLGRLWVAGVEVNWTAFYANEQRQRVPLPTYPFEKQRYWIEPNQGGNGAWDAPYANPEMVVKKSDIANWFYVPSWRRLPISNLTSITSKASWLVFLTPADDLTSLLVEQLTQAGQEVITVQSGTRFAQLGPQRYVLNPSQPGDYQTLLTTLHSVGKVPSQIVHSWLLTENLTGLQDLSGLIETGPSKENLTGLEDLSGLRRETVLMEKGFYSVLYLCLALAKQIWTTPLTLTIIANHLQEVIGTESLCPDKSPVLGLLKVIPQEYPHITCRSLDVEEPATKSDKERLVKQLLLELQTTSIHRTIAYRGTHRWVQTFEPISLPAEASSPGLPFRQGGVYLITGGLGQIGLLIAEYLAKTFQAKLILLGRTQLPPKAEWTQWLATHEETDNVSHKLRKVQHLETLGGEVLLASVDVSNLLQMQAVFTQTEAQWGTVHGVIHAAGIVGKASVRTIADTDRAYCEQHFQGKIEGLKVLAEVLQNRTPDWVLLFSSLSPILGGLGFAAYAGANTFMDAFVNQRHSQGTEFLEKTPFLPRWISVNWDDLEFDDKPVDHAKMGAQLRSLAISFQEFLEVWPRVVACSASESRLIVCATPLQPRIDQWVEFDVIARQTATEAKSQARHARPNLLNPYVPSRDELETALVVIWERLLGMSPIGIYDNFFELGGNSLLITQMVSHIRKTFQVELSLTQLFEEPRVADFAEQIKVLKWATKAKPSQDQDAEEREEGEL